MQSICFQVESFVLSKEHTFMLNNFKYLDNTRTEMNGGWCKKFHRSPPKLIASPWKFPARKVVLIVLVTARSRLLLPRSVSQLIQKHHSTILSFRHSIFETMLFQHLSPVSVIVFCRLCAAAIHQRKKAVPKWFYPSLMVQSKSTHLPALSSS